MTEPTTSAAGGFAIGKALGGVLGIGFLTSFIGLAVMLPKTTYEALLRIFCTMAGSFLGGPLLCVAVYWKYPEIFSSGVTFALKLGIDPEAAVLVGILMVSAPILSIAGLPFWWLAGSFVRYFEKRKAEDIAELLVDAAHDAKRVVTAQKE